MKQLIGAFVCAFVLTSSNAQTGYWQQELKYKISVTLNDQDHSLDAFEQIVYTNHSPDTLRFIWFHLWPNAFKNDKTAYSEQMLQNGDTHFYFGGKEDRGYINRLDFRVDDVAAKLEDHPQDIDIVKLILPKPLPPQQSITITTPFHVQLPEISSRGGHHGQSYQITQWYPKPAVYDRKGWHPMPYLDQGEFFSEFGSFDVQITLPKNYTVAATGDLQNAEEKEWLLSRKNIPAPASNQGKKKPAKLGEKKLKKEDQFPPSDRVTKTLRYYQERVHDFAWFADKRWLVNHATMQLSSGKPIDLYAFYPPWQAKNWSTSLDMLRDAVQKRSAWLGEYPYSTISIVQGYSTGGMEYPTLSIIRGYSNTKDLDLTIEHEAGHNWLYGILGSNERDHPWMDEGMNTYYDNRYSEIKFPDTKKTGGGLFGDLSSEKMDRIVYQTLIAEKLDQPISTSSEAFTVDNYNYVGYTKTGDWMKLLEMQLGQPLFDSCMHVYYQTWQFKHPYPEDFKATIDRVSGRNNDSIFNLLNETGTLYPKTKKKLKLFWISCGASDNLIMFSKRTHDYLVKNDIPHIYYIEPGVHDFKVWKDGLYMFSQLIFKPVDTSTFSKYPVVGAPASSNVRSAQFPQILADHRVIFRVNAPDAQRVQIDLGKKYDMMKDTGGYWQVTTDSIGEGFHYYSLLVDGVAVADPSSESFYGMGRMASGIEIPFAGGGYYAMRNVPHGDIRIKKYFSTVTNSWRQFYIYTPPGYDVNINDKYPVLYILHGGGEDERGWATQGKTDIILDNLIADKKARPMLVVMMDGNLSSGGLAGFGEQSLKKFEDELKNAVIPFVEKSYRTETDANNRALAGLSLGGLQTLYAGLRNTNMFSYLGVFSSGWFANQPALSDPQYAFMKENATSINNSLKSFWIAMGGKEDIAYNNCKIMLAKFDEMGVKYTYSEYPGGHTWPVWRNNLYNFAQILFK